MIILELFSGTQSLADTARVLGHELVTLDILAKHSPTICVDILDWNPEDLRRNNFHFIHASVPCESYSRCRSTSGERPLQAADAIVQKTLEVLAYFHRAKWTIGNPAGSLLWQRTVMCDLAGAIAKTSYCADGFPYQKRTWFANNLGLLLRPECDKKTCEQVVSGRHKEHAQKGGGGTSNRYHTVDELHRIPPRLCKDILLQLQHPTTQSDAFDF